jgi:hypothetical protein
MRPLPKNIEVVDEEMAAVYRAIPPVRRLQLMSDMFTSARRMILSHLRAEHPEWSEAQVNDEAGRRLSHGGD